MKNWAWTLDTATSRACTNYSPLPFCLSRRSLSPFSTGPKIATGARVLHEAHASPAMARAFVSWIILVRIAPQVCHIPKNKCFLADCSILAPPPFAPPSHHCCGHRDDHLPRLLQHSNHLRFCFQLRRLRLPPNPARGSRRIMGRGRGGRKT